MSWRFSSPTRLSKQDEVMRDDVPRATTQNKGAGQISAWQNLAQTARPGESVALHQRVPSQGTRGSGRSNDLRSSH